MIGEFGFFNVICLPFRIMTGTHFILSLISFKSSREVANFISSFIAAYVARSCDRLVVRTPRCGRGNPGSNPGHGMLVRLFLTYDLRPYYISLSLYSIVKLS